ncbi:MAG: TraB/GumN family protein [Maricaulaceae bacterium]
MTKIQKRFGSLLILPLLLLSACGDATDVATKVVEPAVKAPALYQVSDDDTTIYVMGTVHLLPEDLVWFQNNIQTAFEASDELVIEMVEPDPQTMQGLVMSLAVEQSGKTLRSYFDDELKQNYETRLASLGIPPEALDPFEPWMASVTLSAMQLQAIGLNPESGVEKVLTNAANASGKPISGLETAAQQLGFFDNLSKDAQLFMLESGIEDWDEGVEIVQNMIAEWKDGDVQDLSNLMNEAMVDQPELNTVLLTNRNANWAEWVETRLDAPGIVFMAVGAGHIGGDNGLIDLLGDKGIKATRVAAE